MGILSHLSSRCILWILFIVPHCFIRPTQKRELCTIYYKTNLCSMEKSGQEQRRCNIFRCGQTGNLHQPPKSLPSRLKEYQIVGSVLFKRNYLQRTNIPFSERSATETQPTKASIQLPTVNPEKIRFSTVGDSLLRTRNIKIDKLLQGYRNSWKKMSVMESTPRARCQQLPSQSTIRPKDVWMFDLRDYNQIGPKSSRKSTIETYRSKALSNYRSIQNLRQPRGSFKYLEPFPR